MKRKHWATAISALLVMALVVWYGGWSSAAGGIQGTVCADEDPLMIPAQSGTGPDLAACQQECRSRFGVDPYSRSDASLQWRGGDSGMYYAYAQCIQNCNDRFWKEFDKNMDDLQRGQ
ncbi:MAG: hypothetical protein HY914_18295 [Desulfomonile tiedjei]|nr:hypothetical protein [Desulfomonile tiedjei]